MIKRRETSLLITLVKKCEQPNEAGSYITMALGYNRQYIASAETTLTVKSWIYYANNTIYTLKTMYPDVEMISDAKKDYELVKDILPVT